MSSPMTIPLRIANKTAYVWDVDDIALIRSKYHICGVLGGTLPHLSQQNVFLGVPLVLLPEEATLLVDIGAAHFVDDPSAYHAPTMHQLKKWAEEQNQSMSTQLSQLEEKTMKEEGRAMSEEAIRKRKEREEKKRTKEMDRREAAGEEGIDEFPTPEPTSTVIHSSTPIASQNLPYTIIIPASASTHEWYNPSLQSPHPSPISSPATTSPIYLTLDLARAAGIWTYPDTPFERARCEVLKDLWSQGYFMGGGIKFGGEYLVYPGDPLRYHSHFAATVITSPITSIKPMEIIAHGRLGTATKKAHLLCSWDEEKKKVDYLTVEWAGFG